jgi:hypothetical protein
MVDVVIVDPIQVDLVLRVAILKGVATTIMDTFTTNSQPAISTKHIGLPELTGFPKFQELGWSNIS